MKLLELKKIQKTKGWTQKHNEEDIRQIQNVDHSIGLVSLRQRYELKNREGENCSQFKDLKDREPNTTWGPFQDPHLNKTAKKIERTTGENWKGTGY